MKLKIAIIGGGASSLSFATKIDTARYDVYLFEKTKRIGSKLLVAGNGGFNLTHSEDISQLSQRYSPSSFLKKSLTFFDNSALRAYFNELGVSTYIGSSGRVFPDRGIKPAQVLKKVEKKILTQGVSIQNNMEWTAIEQNNGALKVTFTNGQSAQDLNFDFVVFGLGGASWKITGSSGYWTDAFAKHDIQIRPFEPSNCALQVNWPEKIRDYLPGKYLKNIAVTLNNERLTGEIVFTEFGLEGTPIYTLSQIFRNIDNQNIKHSLFIDFKPNVSHTSLINKLQFNSRKSWTSHVESALNLSKVQMRLIKTFLTKEEFTTPETLCKLIKAFPIQVKGLAPIDEAISTVGGIDLEEINEHFELYRLPNAYVIGEMLDWDAPTGGYLLQACFSMGQQLAHHFNQLNQK